MKTPSNYKVLNIRAEVVLAELLEQSDELNAVDFSIVPNGGFNKVVNRDIQSIDQIENEHGVSKSQVKVVRKGMYDALPDGLFHELFPVGQSGSQQKTLMLQQFKKRKIQEKNSRRFFSPFDQVFNHYRLRLEQEERKVLTGFPIGSRHSLFDIIWSDFNGTMDNYQKSILFSLLPLAHHIVGNQRYTELAFEAMIGWPVAIQHKYDSQHIQLENEMLSLGHYTLSNDFLLGTVSDEKEVVCAITVGPVSIAKACDFLPNGRGYRVLETLSDYFIPLDVHVAYDFEIETSELIFEETVFETGNHRLGYTIEI